MTKMLLQYAAIAFMFSTTALANDEPSRMTYDMATTAMNAAEAHARQKELACDYFNYRSKRNTSNAATLRWHFCTCD